MNSKFKNKTKIEKSSWLLKIRVAIRFVYIVVDDS